MNLPFLSPSRRLRRTPFSEGVERAGVKAYTVYNHMLLPTVFRSVQEDCDHLKSAVQVWDVACERQVEIRGPDAARLVQMLTPRDLRKMAAGQCYYVPMVDGAGGMLNDPVAVRLDDDRFWVSIADSDLLFWIKGIAHGMSLNVQVDEPDVSPLAVQGPRADDLMARVFGDAVRQVRFFRFGWFDFHGTAMAIARSGYSKQGGFEIYVDGTAHGMPLWNTLMEAGADLDVRAGCPNLIERVEGGLLSYGNDMTRANNPYECGLGKFCTAQTVTGSVGGEALAQVALTGPSQQIRPIAIAGAAVPPCMEAWHLTDAGGNTVGQVTSAVWSHGCQTNVAIGMVQKAHWEPGTQLTVHTQHGARPAEVRSEFFNTPKV